MKKLLRRVCKGQKGFTLVELLIVVAILGVLASVAVPKVAGFIETGKAKAYETELHDVQTAVMAMLASSESGALDPSCIGVSSSDMSDIKTADDPALLLSGFLAGLDGTVIKSGCEYSVSDDGTVTQTPPGAE